MLRHKKYEASLSCRETGNCKRTYDGSWYDAQGFLLGQNRDSGPRRYGTFARLFGLWVSR
jgi:hypothetical protein